MTEMLKLKLKYTSSIKVRAKRRNEHDYRVALKMAKRLMPTNSSSVCNVNSFV